MRYSQPFLSLSIALLFASAVWAQMSKHPLVTAPNWHENVQYQQQRKAQTSFARQMLTPKSLVEHRHELCTVLANCPLVKAATQHATERITQLQNPHLCLKPTQIAQSQTGYHVKFAQTYNGIEVYNTYIQVNITHRGEIWLMNHNLPNFDQTKLNLPNTQTRTNNHNDLTKLLAQLARDFGANQTPSTNDIRAVVLFTDDYTALQAFAFKASNQQGDYAELLADEHGNLIYQKELTHHFADKPKPQQNEPNQQNPKATKKEEKEETQGTGFVFMPDPITSAEVFFGKNGKYTDGNDADAAELNAERKTADLDVTLNNATYSLENPRVKIVEYQNPIAAPVTSSNGVFDFTRSDSGFEDVNAFYHADTYLQYLLNVGFTGLQNQQVWFDTHAENGADQSRHRYDYTRNKHVITHGEGGVDDAEDADVIIHELGHGISWAACNECNDGEERNAIDEAACDYFATSYSRSISDYKWQNMFSWDGHNPFFSGRNMQNDKHYPEDIDPNSIYPTSEIFSAALMEIWTELGRDKTDRLILQSLYSFTRDIDMPTAAEIVINTDNVLNNGENYTVLCYYFNKRGLYNGNCDISADAGNDQTVCLGDTITLGQLILPDVLGGLFWSPGIPLNDSTIAYPQATPDRTGNFIVHLTDKNDNVVIRDTVLITVNYCPDTTAIPTQISLLNTDRFAQGRGDILLEVPQNTNTSTIEVFDAAGHRLRQITHEGDNRLILPLPDLPNGVYLLRIKIDESEEKVFKVAKLR